MNVDSAEEEVKQAFFSFLTAYNEGNVKLTLESFSKNNPAVIGTGKNEVNIGEQEIIREINKFSDFKKETNNDRKRTHNYNQERFVVKQIQIRNSVAWLTIIDPSPVNANVMSAVNEEMRITVVLEKINQEWKIINLHASLPDARLEEGEFRPSKSGLRASIETWLKEFDENPNLSHELKMSRLKDYLQKAQEIMAQSM